MEWRKVFEGQGSFADDNPAQYDQRTAELAEKIQKAEGFILYVYNRTGEDEEGDMTGEGHAVVGCTPGLPIYQFLHEGVDTINDVLKEMIDRARKECEEDAQAND